MLALPRGGKLLAEMALWSLNASPEELADHWDKVIASGERDVNTLDQLMTYWVRRDPHGALAHTQGGDQANRCYWALARIDPQLALDSVDPKNTRGLAMVLRAIGQVDPGRALALMDQYSGYDREAVIEGITEGLADLDPEQAVKFSAEQNDFEEGRLRWWLAKDPRAAFAWSLENQALSGDTLAEFLPVLMSEDSAYFAAEIARLPTGRFKQDLLKEQAGFFAGQDPERAFDFVNAHEGKARLALMGAMGEPLFARDPDLAKGLLRTLLDEENFGTHDPGLMYFDWVDSMIESDPVSVLEIAREASLGSDEVEVSSPESTAFSKWLRSDAEASKEWVGSLESGVRRDQFLKEIYSEEVHQEDADFAHLMQMTDLFDDAEGRSQSVSEVPLEWGGISRMNRGNFTKNTISSDDASSPYFLCPGHFWIGVAFDSAFGG